SSFLTFRRSESVEVATNSSHSASFFLIEGVWRSSRSGAAQCHFSTCPVGLPKRCNRDLSISWSIRALISHEEVSKPFQDRVQASEVDEAFKQFGIVFPAGDQAAEVMQPA